MTRRKKFPLQFELEGGKLRSPSIFIPFDKLDLKTELALVSACKTLTTFLVDQHALPDKRFVKESEDKPTTFAHLAALRTQIARIRENAPTVAGPLSMSAADTDIAEQQAAPEYAVARSVARYITSSVVRSVVCYLFVLLFSCYFRNEAPMETDAEVQAEIDADNATDSSNGMPLFIRFFVSSFLRLFTSV